MEKESKPITAWSWDRHSKKRSNEYETPIKDCQFVKGKCYCDGSCLRAEDYLKLLIEKGSDAVFEQLEKDYSIEFGK